MESRRKGLSAPAILIVGSVIRLKETLSWYEKKPLFGRKILVTRSREQSRKMSDKIYASGGDPLAFPTIEITPPTSYGPLDAAIDKISSYDWVVFTSENGVELFFRRFFDLGRDIRQLAGPRFGAIGPVTAKAISSRGIRVDMLAKEFVAEGILSFFENQDLSGRSFLIPRAEKARDILPEGLVGMGASVEVVPVYKTVLPSGQDVETIKKMLLD
jgi:uroporphyrinogen III methyltransferase/synthase